jgi:hypothetical protein
MHPLYLAATSSAAGITTAVVSIFTALTLLITALTGLSVARTAARKAAEVQAATVENQAVVTSKLDVIHTLTNATLSAAKQAELDATRRELILTRELIDYRAEGGHEPSAEMLAAVVTLRERVDRLTVEMTDRAAQAASAGAQMSVERDRQK